MQNNYRPCPCGSGKKFKFCCQSLPDSQLNVLLSQAEKFPVSHCLIMQGWQEAGIAPAFVARQIFDETFLLGTYMVDIYCLGLKDSFAVTDATRSDIGRLGRGLPGPLVDISYEDIRSLVLGAIEYARKLGFEPAAEWSDSKYIIEGEKAFAPQFTFGKDGKPLYIEGPHDDAQTILAKLHGTEHHYIVAANDE